MSEAKYRSAVSGEYVTAEYAAQHPDTTVAEVDGKVSSAPEVKAPTVPPGTPGPGDSAVPAPDEGEAV